MSYTRIFSSSILDTSEYDDIEARKLLFFSEEYSKLSLNICFI